MGRGGLGTGVREEGGESKEQGPKDQEAKSTEQRTHTIGDGQPTNEGVGKRPVDEVQPTMHKWARDR